MRDAAAIIVIGNEILTGKVTDSNSPFLVQELRGLGLPVARILVIPDEVATIADAVRSFSDSFRHVFTSGGVGPTLDDVTLEGIAQAFGVPLELDAQLERVIRAHFGDATQDSHLKMARIPKGSELRWCEGLPWPILAVRNVMVLPGDPGILRRKFLAVRESYRRTPFHLRRVFTTLEEGALSPHLDAIHEAHPGAALGSYPVYDDPAYSVQVTIEAKERSLVEAALHALLSRLDPSSVVRVA
jgi:molybdenum cofactor synthesis domain-containing protein